jgi:spore germination cell wall hydrolase CwlJ-like protein
MAKSDHRFGAILGHGLARGALLLLAAAVVAIAVTGERTSLHHASAMWPRQLADFKLGRMSAPTTADPAEEIRCLALNIYFEARGEPEIGKVAVGQVVMNRVADAGFPATVCAVVQQGGEAARHRCQFSWWCDGQSDRPRDWRAWAESREVARAVYWARIADPTRGALWYHAASVKPGWREALRLGPQFGQHIFYQRKPQDPRAVQTVVAN